MKKILILHTSVGLGHKTMAENIGAALLREGFEVKLADIGKVQEGNFQKIVVGVHQFINKYVPLVWTWLYAWGYRLAYPFRLHVASFNCERTKRLLEEFEPDLVIATQTSASAVIAYLKQTGFYKNKFAIAFSDYHLHPFWLYSQADFYLVNIPQQKDAMLSLGILSEHIYVCGMTLQPKLNVDREAVRNRLGITDGQKIVLVGSGSLGSGIQKDIVLRLSKNPDWSIVVVCGKNTVAFTQLTQSIQKSNVHILGYYKPMSELYAISDIFLTKPGGLTVAEGLSWGLPMLLTHWLPGQEELNVKYLTSRKLVIDISGQDMLPAVETELKMRALKNSLVDNPYISDIVSYGKSVVAAVKNELLV